MRKPAPRLASLLGSSASAPLEGVDLRSRMPPDDAETLKWHLDGGPRGAGCPRDPLALSLVDAFCIHVQCEFFMAEFRGDGLERNVVVGINEVGERNHEVAVYTTESTNHASNGLALPPLQEYVLQKRQEDTSAEAWTTSGSSSDFDRSDCSCTRTVDALVFEFKYVSGEIVAASPSFSELLGHDSCVGSSVLDVMGSKEKPRFRNWLVTTANALLNVHLPQEVESEPVLLKARDHQRSSPLVGHASGHNSKTRSHKIKFRRQWATLAVTFPEKPHDQSLSDYVLRVEVRKRAGPCRQAAACETGFLRSESTCQNVPKGPEIIGRAVVNL